MAFENPSWKQKLDPAFDRLIKFYLQFLDMSGLPSNEGWIVFDERFYKLWEKKGMRGWLNDYDKERSDESRMLIKSLTQQGGTVKEIRKKKRDFKKWLSDEIKVLPGDSQKYYMRVFEPYYSEAIKNDPIGRESLEEAKERIRNCLADVYVLTMHIFLIELETEVKSTARELLEKKYTKLPVVMDILLSLYDSISRLVFQESLFELIRKAKEGSEDHFFKLLQIDRSAVDFEWARIMIRKAQMTGNEEFFRKMAKSITSSPLQNAKVYGQVRIVVLLFWSLGLRKLENNELIELLEDCGLRVQDDPESFRKFINRLVSSDHAETVKFSPR
jgi:hypothetical protein